VGVFNFTGEEKTVSLPGCSGEFTDMISGEQYTLGNLTVPAYGFYYLERILEGASGGGADG